MASEKPPSSCCHEMTSQTHSVEYHTRASGSALFLLASAIQLQISLASGDTARSFCRLYISRDVIMTHVLHVCDRRRSDAV
jgi:hypothetical protein